MDLFLVVVIVLFVLAISDLVVGVSNDAVNFLNSAVGSKVAPRYVIMIVASLGILAGTVFSSGLMEVARKGIFNPEMFYFQDIMMVFLAVMLTDVILLDLFNTFGLPTSTTVSIVFELLGAAVAVSIIKVAGAGENFTEIIKYINTSKALAIISGILLSVVISFTVGAIIQFFTRLVFTFDFAPRVKRYGSVFASLTLTAITFFILFKGAKGATFISPEASDWIKNNISTILLYSFILWAAVFQMLLWFTKFNILKPLVLIGTFALALAFAANDLVNFIGVPLAGLSSYTIAEGLSDPFTHLMVELKGKVSTPTTLLLLAGVVMVLTLWFNKKARTVTKTEVNLGRQHEGFERFESSLIARVIVRMSMSLANIISIIVPNRIQNFINNRFNISKEQLKAMNKKDAPAFDMLRASVNLMVASILISIATSFKLPLSTTYVTFMVAMGTSLSDRAWGRESAVYRVNGVLTVIGGWFFTAFMAFTVSAIFATIIYYGELAAIILLGLVAVYILFRTHVLHRTREKEEEEAEKTTLALATNGSEAITALFNDIAVFLNSIPENLRINLEALAEEDRNKFGDARKLLKGVKKHSNMIISEIVRSVKLLKENEVKQGRRYGKIIGSLQEIHAYMRELHNISFSHIDNNHGRPGDDEIADLKALISHFNAYIQSASEVLKSKKFEDVQPFTAKHDELVNYMQQYDENELIRIREGKSNSRNSMLLLNLLTVIENISNHVRDLVGVCRKNYQKIASPNTSE
ncbi:MAG: inorganic phosphate transporter [Melioribacteraceae bacterium]|nr:inorganic phosphate transporter [Melioribacteraceae bacterium]